jgi:hypothetical protein
MRTIAPNHRGSERGSIMTKKRKRDMTVEELRVYNASAKARSRERKRALGLCIACGVTVPPKGQVTCDACNYRSQDSERSLIGKFLSPRKKMVRNAAKFRITHGERVTISGISEELQLPKDYVRDVLREQGFIP